MTLALVAISLVVGAVLAVRQSPLPQWGAAALVIGLLTRLDFIGGAMARSATDIGGLILVLIPAIILLLLSIEAHPQAGRHPAPIYGAVKKILPRVSRTEQEALDACTVGWDAELFSGRPDWSKLTSIRPLTLSAEEQAFLDGPVSIVCAMIDDWDTRHNRADLTPEVWQYLKDNGFLGMLIAKEYGGVGSPRRRSR